MPSQTWRFSLKEDDISGSIPPRIKIRGILETIMKFKVLQEALSKALVNASRFTSTRAQLPILANIKLETKKTKLLISATNLETSIVVSIGAQVNKEGELTIPAKVISELVANLSSETIDLEAEKEQLKIESQGFSSVVSGMNTSDFPKIPASLPKNSLVFTKDDFLKSLSCVSFAVSIDETRPILTGVLFIFQKDSLVLVATDGFRLSQKKMLIKGAVKGEQIVLPRAILTEISRLSNEDDVVNFNYSKEENQVIFGVGDSILSSRVLEGEFPDYQKIIPKSSTLKIFIDKEEFLQAIKLASVFARDSANIAKIRVGKESVEIVAESQTSGSQKTKIDAKVEGEGFEIAFNYRFLEEFLHAVSGEEIKIELSDPNSPGVFTDTKDPDFLHLIMPVKIQE